MQISALPAPLPGHKLSLVPVSYRIPAQELHQAIEQLAADIARRHPRTKRLVLLGVANGGIELARRIAAILKTLPLGTIDISFHRDDIDNQPIPKEYQPTVIPADVTGATVILIDDVLHTGRTIKAALDELFDHGRPAKVELATLIDRGGRLLPVAADYTGLTLDATGSEKVVVVLDPITPANDHVEIVPAKAR